MDIKEKFKQYCEIIDASALVFGVSPSDITPDMVADQFAIATMSLFNDPERLTPAQRMADFTCAIFAYLRTSNTPIEEYIKAFDNAIGIIVKMTNEERRTHLN